MIPPVLFLVDGSSGAGKSHLLRYVESTHDGATAIRKRTTRPQRSDERGKPWSDLIHVTEPEFEESRLDYHYRFRGNRYGFSRSEICRALDAAPVCLVVVRDLETIRRVARDLPEVRSISVLVHASEEIRRRRLAGVGQSETADHAVASPAATILDPGSYDELLVNEASTGEYHDKIDSMIARYAGSEPYGRKTV
jgi:guanylate kinase